MDIVLGVLQECWILLVEAAPYVLFGFLFAGFFKALLPEHVVARHLGRDDTRSVLKASLFGIPLPLCSCGVIPAAVGLRRQGASRGASAAFLVSTPESGVDSIAITWALLDPIMTVIRPISAFLTAIATGLLINRLPEEKATTAIEPEKPACGCTAEPVASPPLRLRLRDGMRYAFDDLLGDIGRWLLLGIAIAGLITFFVPDDFFVRYLQSEALSLVVMLLAGIPMYICASASTPIAAALVLKGVSPGAALVFLLAGPATNAATITVVARFWGRRAVAVYLGTIAGCSLVLGWLTNRLYGWTGADISHWVQDAMDKSESPFFLLSALVLLGLIIRSHLPGHGAACAPDT